MLTELELKQNPAGKYNRFETKYSRCRKIEELLKERHLSRAMLARLFGVHKSTIGRNLDDMSSVVCLSQDEKGRFYIEN